MEFSIFFPYEKERAGDRRLGRADVAHFKVIIDIFFKDAVLSRSEVIEAFLFHDSARLEFDGVILL